jgi:hypothetical protein
MLTNLLLILVFVLSFGSRYNILTEEELYQIVEKLCYHSNNYSKLLYEKLSKSTALHLAAILKQKILFYFMFFFFFYF